MPYIDEVNVDNQNYKLLGATVNGTCATPAGTELKVFTLPSDAMIKPNQYLVIDFTYANTYGDTTASPQTYPKVNLSADYVNIPICDSRGHFAGTGCWENGDTIIFFFTGTKLLITNSDVRQKSSEYTQYADGTIEYNKNYADSNFRLKTQSSTDLVTSSSGTVDLEILNPRDNKKNGYILIVMGNIASGDYAFSKIYHIRVGYDGNTHQESLISDLSGAGVNVSFNFTVVNGKLRVNCTLDGNPLSFKYKLI